MFQLDLLEMTIDELIAERDNLIEDIDKLKVDDNELYWCSRTRGDYWEYRQEIGYASYSLYKVKVAIEKHRTKYGANLADY